MKIAKILQSTENTPVVSAFSLLSRLIAYIYFINHFLLSSKDLFPCFAFHSSPTNMEMI